MTSTLTGHRNIDDPAPRDLTRAEVEAAKAHRDLWWRVKAFETDIVTCQSASDWVTGDNLTEPLEIAAMLRDYAADIEEQIKRIERGECRPEEAV